MLPSLVPTARSRASSRVRVAALLLAGLALAGTGATAATADSTGVLVPNPTASGEAVPAGAHPDVVGEARWKPPADTIVGVSGSALDGFTIARYDGSKLFPPTDSEARAECGEYDRRVARVRCNVEVTTWYRDLGDLKLSLRWARQQ